MDTETLTLAVLSATEEWREDANNRLPYGLCKKYGIDVPPHTTPREAWELLKEHGIDPDGAYRRTAESWERQKAEQRAARKAAGEQSPQKGKEGPSEAAGKAGKAGGEQSPQKGKEGPSEAAGKAGKEAGKKAGGKTPATARPEPERVEPKRFRSAREASEYLEDRCNVVITASWEKGVCASAKKEIAGTVAALEERYGALDREHNFGWPIEFADGKGPKLRDIAAVDCYPYDGYQTARLSFYGPYFGSEEALEDARSKVRAGKNPRTAGFYMPSAEGMEIAYLAAHEYGHCVEYRILRDKGVIGDDEFDDAVEQIKDEILQIARRLEPWGSPGKPISEGGCISGYGRKNPREFFAECFANSVCGKPNALGRAMAVYLDRHGIGRCAGRGAG